MPNDSLNMFRSAQDILKHQDEELLGQEARQMLAVHAFQAAGNGDINNAFKLNGRFRLLFVRCHFIGGAGAAALSISLDHALGSAYDALLDKVATAGTGNDVNHIIADRTMPSPWTFQKGDQIRILWTNPDPGNMSWGLEVGLAPAY